MNKTKKKEKNEVLIINSYPLTLVGKSNKEEIIA
jgi:hypothetical protein